MEIDNKVIALIEEHDFSINSYEDGIRDGIRFMISFRLADNR